MPRQIHVTITEAQKQACWRIAKARTKPTTWQEVAREILDAGLATTGESRSPKTQV